VREKSRQSRRRQQLNRLSKNYTSPKKSLRHRIWVTQRLKAAASQNRPSEAKITQPHMVIRAAAKRPMILAV
jgi:hypothetical protein